ncbi:hypothetical protein BFS30_02135 [Pedobacter steynii]|uniref:TonB-linked outer membrane protein, SusC/RagA family n=2 Tax=Pedobacter steynii TaxID=430522 RepID=A0A1D7QBV4_9SPHI|nr:hypothetical protein BFS30_02135 [Pedobacter steynii]
MKFYHEISYRLIPCMKKSLFIMKLIIVLITTVFLQVSLATDTQKITLSEKNASLEKLFKKIRTQSGYDFFCDIDLLKSARKVSINVKEVSLEEALKYCLMNQDLTYTINNKIIVIKRNPRILREEINQQLKDLNLLIKVVDENNRPLPDATITVKRTGKSFITNEKGESTIQVEPGELLLISYVGYEPTVVKASGRKPGAPLIIMLSIRSSQLKEIGIVSTGYQDLPKERATGSFQVITAKQLEHSTDQNLLKRLEGITTGLDFNNKNFTSPTNSSRVKISPLASLTIRGKNNLQALPSSDPNQASGQPLVVIDGIASPYSIDKINPNEVESINILQDAAAASIWGSRAANGVIVVKTKRGEYDRPVSIFFNSNVNITDKMDLFYNKYMSTSDYVDAQVAQLNYNYSQNPVTVSDPDISMPQPFLTPVAEIWNSWKRDKIALNEYNSQLDKLRNNDLRNDLTKYFLRKSILQSYALGIAGGTGKYAYRLSGGFDKNRNNTIHSDANRINVNYNASVKPTKNLEFQAIIGYSQQNRNEQDGGNTINGAITGEGMYPYTRLVDDQENPAVVSRTYRPAFINLLAETYGNKILDMTWKPLEDINQSYLKYKSQLINMNLNVSYKFSPVFSGTITYNNAWGQDESTELRGQNSYFMRSMINRFTDPFTFERAIPLGGFYIPNIGKSNNQTLRGQLNANKTWADKHVLTVIGGVDVSQNYNNFRDSWFYGYNEKTLTVNNGLPFGVYKNTLFIDPNTGFPDDLIPYSSGFGDFKIRSFSLYSNAAYTYDRRYTFSASIRNDISSTFGQGTNKHGASYFSLGGSWAINNEKFYHMDWLPNLQLRATFGYNGNVNTTVSPVPLIRYTNTSFVGNRLPYASTNNGANRLLRPEKAAMMNLALNFGIKNNRLSGSIEYYIRKTTDLISTTSLDPSTGFSLLPYNAADLRGTGIDITLNSLNLKTRSFSWESTLLFSNNQVKVTKLFSDKANTVEQVLYSFISFNEGAGLSRLYAFRWAGLDPETGDPMGYIDGNPVRITGDIDVYNAIATAPLSTAHYFGSSVPVYFGSLRNTFNYKNFSVSANILYKLGYYFRRSVTNLVRYSALFNDNVMLGSEYNQRWQKPGDEKSTNVPSLIFPVTGPGGQTEIRDLFYQYADVNVLKADHIRLQEINLSYTFKEKNWVIKNPRIYANISNLGILWRANKQGIDPDISDYPQPKTYSLGLSASF